MPTSDQLVTDTPTKKNNYNAKNANSRIADDFVNNPMFVENLVYFTDYACFFLYTDNRYFKKLSEREMQKIVLRFCEVNYPGQGFTSAQISDIIGLIRLKVLREAIKEDGQYIAFNDCLYNTRTHKTEDFSNRKLVSFFLPYDISEINNPTPVFDNFLSTSLVLHDDNTCADPELIRLVQEMFGFLFIDNLKATGAFFLYGKGANGKSVISKLIENIFGDEYVSAMSLADFAKPFAVGDIINKRVNISNEEDERYVSGKMFKVLVTGESLRGEHKFGSGYKMKSNCKFLFSTNKLPTFDGLDDGLKRRIFIIPFYRSFSASEQDKDLDEKLIQEIPGIIGWSLAGAKRLQENGYVFSDSKAMRNVFIEFEEEMSSAIMFFNERYVISPNGRVPRSVLYEEYTQWCKDNGKRGVSSVRKFNRELLDNIPGLLDNVVMRNGDSTCRGFNCEYSPRDQRDIPQYEQIETVDINELF